MEKLLVANYKMNGDKNFYNTVQRVMKKINVKDTKIVLCPPFVYMPFLKIKNNFVSLGSQDISNVLNKQSTGQISPVMIKEFGATYSIIGHSERRALGETDELVADKVKLAQDYDITPIICVGESDKKAGLDIVKKQVEAALKKAENNKKIVFAYEPIWAIGSGEKPTINKINQAVKIIKQTAKSLSFEVFVLYGGSVNLQNYKEILTANINGLLMGGVSLKIDDFTHICKGE